jgi:hypothetical protein
MMRLHFSLGLVLLASTQVVASVPAECIQLPSRQQSCPHLLYKKSALAIPKLGVQPNDMICICLSDMAIVLTQSTRPEAQLDKLKALEQFQQAFALDEKQIKALVRY